MRYGSVCSGIEAATCAWHGLGWEPAFFSEIEAFPKAVLAYHYPSVPDLGDFTQIGAERGPVDLLVGGTPCQSFSVAGLRKGMADERGNLALEFLRLAARLDARWILWENVPGVLSSNGGRDFGAFLGGLAELGYGFAYRVLDAQFFGVAQRRRRVFVVGHAGGLWQRAAAVLFERASLRGDPAPRRKARAGSPGGAANSPRVGVPAIAGTLDAGGNETGGIRPPGTTLQTVGNLIPDVAGTLGSHKQGGVRNDLDSSGAYIPIQNTVIGRNDEAGPGGRGHGDAGDPMFTLERSGPHAVCAPAIAFHVTQDPISSSGATPALGCGNALGCGTLGVATPVTFDWKKGNDVNNPRPSTMNLVEDATNTLGATREPALFLPGMAVRRLTPRECSRLQGFPDDYLELEYADAEEAHAAQVLRGLWREAGAVAREGWRSGVAASVLTPEVLLAGVHVGWLSWEVALGCAAARRAPPGEVAWPEGFVRELRRCAEHRPSPHRRESFEQLARELGRPLPLLPLESAQAREALRSHRLWPQAQAEWPLRHARPAGEGRRGATLNADGPRYRALGNSMAVPVMAWIGERIQAVEDVLAAQGKDAA